MHPAIFKIPLIIPIVSASFKYSFKAAAHVGKRRKKVVMIGEEVWSHFGQWGAVVVWIAIYTVFLLFIPFYKKSRLKPAGTYIAFVVAFALEMFGIPFSMYAIGWAFGYTLPEGVL